MNKRGELDEAAYVVFANWDRTGEIKDSERRNSDEFKKALEKEDSVELKDSEMRMVSQVTGKSRSTGY